MEEMEIQGDGDKYLGQPIAFYEKGTHYELVLMGELYAIEDFPLYKELLVDLKEADKSGELHIFINSRGGELDTLNMLLPNIMDFAHTVGIVNGTAMSAGFLLWVACKERYVSPYSQLMFHSASSEIEGKASQIATLGGHLAEVEECLFNEIGLSNVLSKEDLREGRDKEMWYSGRHFIERGLAFDYAEYKGRRIPERVCVLQAGGRLFGQYDEDGTYVEYMPYCPDGETRKFSYAEIKRIHNLRFPVIPDGESKTAVKDN